MNDPQIRQGALALDALSGGITFNASGKPEAAT
jgi:hypothetical protein